MKIKLSLRVPAARFVRLCGSAFALGLFCVALTAGAAGRIVVGSGGVGPLTFDLVANPTPTNGFSATSVGTSAGTITTAGGMDTAVGLLAASGITTILPQSNTQNPPSAAVLPRYNYGGFYLQSRTTTTDFGVLMGTFRNDSGQDRNTVTVDYDQGAFVIAGSAIDESPGLWGFRVYYSLTGAAGTWVHIPDLDTPDNTQAATTKHASINLASAWEVGSDLYILWADDNGPSSDSGALREGAWTIDNLQIGFGVVTPVSITTQPHNITAESCHSSNLTVVATGSGPLTYQWYKGSIGSPVTGGTAATLTFANPQPSDAGSYFVRVTGPGTGNFQDSSSASVTVNPDSTAPDVVSAIGKIDGTNLVVTFTEPMDASAAGNPDSYFLTTGGIGDFPSAVTLNPAHTVATLRFASPRDPTATYDLVLDPSVIDVCRNPLGNSVVPLWYEIRLMTFQDTVWKFDDSGTDQGIDWHFTGYDDSAWQSGPALLDVKAGVARTNVPGLPTNLLVKTFLSLHTTTPPYDTTDIPTVYFRTHLTIPAEGVQALSLRTIVDDADVMYINDGPAVHQNTRYPNPVDTFEYVTATVGDAGIEGPFNISTADVHPGDNLISVSVHQGGATSSDMTLAYEIIGTVTAIPSTAPPIAISKDPGTGEISLTWPAGSGAALYEANAVDAAAGAWSAVAGAGDGAYSFTPPGTGGTQKFYTLRK